MNPRVPLSDLIAALKVEMLKAHERAVTENSAIMEFEECEFEFAIQLEADAKVGVKIFAVVDVSGGGKASHSNKVKIKYTALEGGLLAPVQDVGPKRKGPALKRQKDQK